MHHGGHSQAPEHHPPLPIPGYHHLRMLERTLHEARGPLRLEEQQLEGHGIAHRVGFLLESIQAHGPSFHIFPRLARHALESVAPGHHGIGLELLCQRLLQRREGGSHLLWDVQPALQVGQRVGHHSHPRRWQLHPRTFPGFVDHHHVAKGAKPALADAHAHVASSSEAGRSGLVQHDRVLVGLEHEGPQLLQDGEARPGQVHAQLRAGRLAHHNLAAGADVAHLLRQLEAPALELNAVSDLVLAHGELVPLAEVDAHANARAAPHEPSALAVPPFRGLIQQIHLGGPSRLQQFLLHLEAELQS
mmetsp:Transcript_30404/g.85090  ORF Transcript_30404/g.85090 Transcript_30404/m.85090 type:complete len:304 (-) Transcript_30404:807-1718(-)